jgi:hypothetical protein
MTDDEQLVALFKVQRAAAAYAVHTVVNLAPGDAPYLMAVGVPGASHILCLSGNGYDVWRHDEMVAMDLDVDDTANIVIAEHMKAKVRRASAVA